MRGEVKPIRDRAPIIPSPQGEGSDINANVKHGDGFDRTLAFVAVALLLAGTTLFLADGFRDRISADAAVPLLLARRMLETGSPMPADWYYGNGDFWIVGPQLFVLPFVRRGAPCRVRSHAGTHSDSRCCFSPRSRWRAPRVRDGRPR